MILFISLPFTGLVVGMGYQNKIDNIKCANVVSKLNQFTKIPSPTIAPPKDEYFTTVKQKFQKITETYSGEVKESNNLSVW